MIEVLVVVGPGVVADAGLLEEIAAREFAAAGVSGTLVHARDASHVLSLLSSPEGAGCVVVLPGPSGEVRSLIGRDLGAVVWVDVERADGVTAGEGATHLHGRGVGGLAWGIRHAVHRVRHPSRRIAYGPLPEQWGELYLPDLPDAGEPPVVVLVHGGYWRSIWAADIMGPLCADLAGRGLAVWNLEYRRPDLHGWDATTADVAAGLAALAAARAPDEHPQSTDGAAALDLTRVAVVGHSAGAQLALRAVADAAGEAAGGAHAVAGGARVVLAVSLAGVLDLVEGDRRWVGTGAVGAALGGRAPEGRAAPPYADASPLLRLPLRVRQLVVQGAADDLDLVDFSRRYARAAVEAGDEVTYLEMPGDHFDVINPATPIWQATAETIAQALAGGPTPRGQIGRQLT
ncbi:alpha/beta hydrolase [Nonomuraea angiospora]|uniref:Acetyl esterase/lipase n=1 Tax=Nonomuraea angiospora TaxID=46172 RepID=A0ABR9LXK9_9ACTN|nr:alpha/beta hydrolase [Nonomuraea angiospora]MBE1585115.1 acetyl esterase/lipase [Nonomuraea angiospora]